VEIEFDPKKSAWNAERRGLPFKLTAALDWAAAHTIEDRRRDYGETRYLAYAPMQGRAARRLLLRSRRRLQDHPFPQGEQARGEVLCRREGRP